MRGADRLPGAALTHDDVRAIAGVREAPEGVEVARRRGPDADYLFLINRTDRDAHIPVCPEATELLSRKPTTGSVTVPAGEVAVVRDPR